MKPWNYDSEVKVCPECGGTGWLPAYRRPTTNDPYPERPCDCGMGPHEPECDVCGFDVVIPGYDCLACDTVASIPDNMLEDDFSDSLAKAIKVAMQKARAAQ